LIDAIEEVDVELNAEKTRYMLLLHHQNVGQNHVIKIVYILAECGTGQILGNDSNKLKSSSEDIRRLNLGYAYYHSVQNSVFSYVINKLKNRNIQNCNFACGFVRV
jgi:hypothetical protein